MNLLPAIPQQVPWQLTATTTTALNITLRDNATETINAPATVEFNATVSNGQKPYSFNWDFKDGAKEADNDGNIIHTFASPGLYNVTVNVVDSANNTGSASTLVDVADQIVDDQPAIASAQDNSTQDSQPAEVTNVDNTTQAAPADLDNETEGADVSNDNSTSAPPVADEEPSDVIEGTNTNDGSANGAEANNNDTGASIDTESKVDENNSPPIANAGNDLVGKPKEQVILDASKSSDPDAGDIIESYQWEQESGPTAKINDKGSPTPIVTLPNVDEDSTLVFSLTVNDGSIDSKEKDTVSIFVDYVDKLSNDVQQRVLKPADITASEWIPSGDCDGRMEQSVCLMDRTQRLWLLERRVLIALTYIHLENLAKNKEAATPVDPNSIVIDRVVAEITAKKIGNTGYVSFAVDDPGDKEHYFTPSLSIASSSFQKYNYVWETNPVTGEKWTYDSLNSLVAGFKYDGGQSGVQISEIQLTVTYHLPEPAPTG